MTEYCPSCGEERKHDGDECEFCGAYVTHWSDVPVLSEHSGDSREELPESGWQQVKESVFRPSNLSRLMLLAGVIVLFLVITLCSLLEKL